ncbi:MAG: hypothetical protein MK165_03720 [Pirellulaceae bacterium]|nr:hypothetical protein [Pirellulaceae bacterium]
MPRKNRRFFCRSVFLLACLSPTVLCLILVAGKHSSAYQNYQQRSWQEHLQSQLGLTVKIGHVQRGEKSVELHDVGFCDPETAEPLANVRMIDVENSTKPFRISLLEPQIKPASLTRLWNSLHQSFLRTTANSQDTLCFTASKLLLENRTQPQTFSNLSCTIEQPSTGPRLTLEFRIVGEPAEASMRLSVARHRKVSPPSTTWEFHSGRSAIPVPLIADLLPATTSLGTTCRFRGIVRMTETKGKWSGQVEGNFEDLDLDRLVTQRFLRKLSGLADVDLNRCRFENGRLVEATGFLVSDGGVVSRQFLEAAQGAFKLRNNRNTELKTLVRYRELAFGFRIDPTTLLINGNCATTLDGVVLVDETGPLLFDSAEELIPAVALAGLLVPESKHQIAASIGTDALLRRLPLPQISPPTIGREVPVTALRILPETRR